MLLFYVSVFIQIITEGLPISSSGHEALLLCMGKFAAPMQHLFVYALPTVGVVVLFFFSRGWPLIYGTHIRWRMLVALIGRGLCAAGATAILYSILYTPCTMIPLWVGFAITSVLLFSTQYAPRSLLKTCTYTDALLLGVVQAAALIPGVSRFGTVFAAARWLGMSNRRAFDVTWLVYMPLLIGSSWIGLVQLVRADAYDPIMGIVVLTATALCYGALLFSYWVIMMNRLQWFSYYLLVPLGLSYWYCG